MNVLAIDVGTTSMRGILFNEEGKVLSSLARMTPLIIAKGIIEQSSDVYRNALLYLCGATAKEYQVDAVTLTAFRSAPALLDKNGCALTNFIMWQDTRNREICDALAPYSTEIYHTCGAAVNTVFTGSKISWFREHQPELYKKTYKAMVVPDYLMMVMTGVFVTDTTYGSRTSLMNLVSLRWDKRMCELYDVEMDKLCDLIPQGSVAGYTTSAFCELTGIPVGIPVISAGGDQQCGALGLGVIDSSTLEVNSGTGSFVISVIDKPLFYDSSVICNVAAIPNKYTLESNVLSSASALNWLMRNFFPDLVKDDGMDFEAFNQLAYLSPPGANGLYCVPHFQGCGTRKWNPAARAGFWGFTLSSTRNDMARSLYEGICAEIAKSIAALPEGSRKAKEVYIAGGLTRGEIFNRILCDMLNRDLIRYDNDQATAIGAFVSAAVTLGLYPNYGSAVRAVRSNGTVTRYTPEHNAVLAYQKYQDTTESLLTCAGQSGI